MDGERKSMEPTAARAIPGADVQACNSSWGKAPWEVNKYQRRLAHKMVDLLSDDGRSGASMRRLFPRRRAFRRVARQYCGSLGKVANCQVAVSLHWSSDGDELPAVSGGSTGRKEWFEDAAGRRS